MTEPQAQGPVTTSAGFALNIGAKPNLAEGGFVDWDQEFLSRGFMPPEEAHPTGTPATYFGKSTGFGKHAHEKVGGAVVMLQPQASAPLPPAQGAVYGGAAAANVSEGGRYHPPAQQSAVPQIPPGASPNGLVDPRGPSGGMPFAAQLLPLMGQMGHPLGQAAGFGIGAAQPAPVMTKAEPQAQGAFIDWSGFMARMSEIAGGAPQPEEDDDAPTPSTTVTAATGRGTGSVLTYETQKSMTPRDAFDVLMKSMAAIAGGLEKAGGHKYKKRIPKPGGGYRYIYDDEKTGQQSLDFSRPAAKESKPATDSGEHESLRLAARTIMERALAGEAHLQKEVGQFRNSAMAAANRLIERGDMEAAKAFAQGISPTLSTMKTMKASHPSSSVEHGVADGLYSALYDAGKKVYSHFTAKKSRRSDPLVDQDIAGRPLSKGLYSFRRTGGAALPDEYLYDYLAAFVEEACEHECGEDAHKNLEAKNQLKGLARAIMGELVQTIPENPNLMRAVQKFRVTAATIERMLVDHGYYKPQSDGWTDDAASLRAMGGEALALSFAALDVDPYGRPGVELAPRPVDDVSHLLAKSEPVDPYAEIRARQVAQTRALWGSAPELTPQAIAADCPVHTGRDISKAQQLWNPMLPCTCGGRPNPYG